MKLKHWLFTVVTASLAACQSYEGAKAPSALPAGVKLLEQHSPVDTVGIAYQKYELENGLTVVLHQDTSDPLVHVDVTYKVGSSRETIGKSGFAHFFEHMMFQGSKHVADEQHFQLITEAGGSMNGTTNSDRTNYYQTVPANQLEKVLWLEADRMGYLLPAVTQEKFEVQRDTVKNERAQRVDNQPYGLRQERTAEALYPVGHPYSWPVIGYVEDLDRVQLDDLKAFFQTWYAPNNAVLTIGGDIDVAQTLKWVQRYFGKIPAGYEPQDLPKTLVELPETRYLTLEDNVHLPLLQITYPSVYVRHEDEAPLDVLSDILGRGKTSLLYKNLVKDGHAVNALTSHPCRELSCQFQVIVLPNPRNGANLKELQAVVMQTLSEFEKRGVKPDDLARTKASIESSFVYGLQSVSGKVSTLASNEIFDGIPDRVQFDLDRYNNVTAEDVMRVYRRYIKDKHAVILSIVPKGQQALAASDNTYAIPERQLPNYQTQTFTPVAVPEDDFDRAIIPKAGANPPVQVPEIWQTQWDNGIKVLGHESPETPTVTLSLSMEGGPLLESVDKAGVASLTAQMMGESTQNYSNEEMANALALLGSSISFSAGGRYTTVRVQSLSKNLDATLNLLQEKLFRPGFKESDFNRLKQRLLQGMQQQLKKPNVLAAKTSSQLLYGTDNRIGLPDGGTLASVQNITLEDVKAFYNNYYSPALANLVVVGDLPEAETLEKLTFLQAWPSKAYEIPPYQAFPDMSTGKLFFVAVPGAAQTEIKILKRSLPYDATGEQFRTKLMNFPLGGMFNSRINLNLREDKGYTYGVRSGFSGGKTLGRFQVGAGIKSEHTADALRELFSEINRYREQGMTQQELQMMRNAYTQGDALEYETPGSKARFLRHLLTYGLEPEFVTAQNRIIKDVSAKELNALAKQHLDLADAHVLVVGDPETLQSQLQAFAEETQRELVPLQPLL